MKQYEMEKGKKMVKAMFWGSFVSVLIFAFHKRTINEGLFITWLLLLISDAQKGFLFFFFFRKYDRRESWAEDCKYWLCKDTLLYPNYMSIVGKVKFSTLQSPLMAYTFVPVLRAETPVSKEFGSRCNVIKSQAIISIHNHLKFLWGMFRI